METMLEAIERLRANGYRGDFVAAPGGKLRCRQCGEASHAATMTVDETVRFEGDSNPDDEAILVALTTPCGRHGLYTAAFGPDTPPEDSLVLQALASAHRRP